MNAVLSTVRGLRTESVMFGWASGVYGHRTLDHIKNNFKLTFDGAIDTITVIFLNVIKVALTYAAMIYLCPPLTPMRSIGLIAIGWFATLLAKEVKSRNSVAHEIQSLLDEGGKIGIFSGCLLTMACAVKFLGVI